MRLRVPAFVSFALLLFFSLSVATTAQQITITLIAESRTTHFEWQQEMAQAFQELHPHITIDLVSIAGSGDVLGKMQSMLAGGHRAGPRLYGPLACRRMG